MAPASRRLRRSLRGTVSPRRCARSARCWAGGARGRALRRERRAGRGDGGRDVRHDVALRRPRRGDGRDAGAAISSSSCPRTRRTPRTIRWRRRRCWSCRRPSRRPTPTCSPIGARRCGGWRRCSGCRRGSRRAVLVASAAALFRRVVPRAPFDALCEVIASGTTLDRDATVAALVRAGFSRSPVVEDAGTFAVRGAVIDLFPPVYQPPDAHRAVRRRGRVDPPLRRGDAADAAPAGRGLPAPGARDHPDRRRRSARAHPGRRRRRRVSVVEDARACSSRSRRASSSSASRRWRPRSTRAWRRCSTTCPRTTLCVVEDPEAVIDEARRQATPAARGGGAAPRRAPAGAARRRTSCWARTRRRRRWRRGGGWSCAPSRSSASTRRPTRRRASASSRRRTRRCAPSCTRRARPRPAPSKGEVDIGAPLRDRLRALDGRAATAFASSRPTGRTPSAWSRCCARSASRPTSRRRAPATSVAALGSPGGGRRRWRC